MQNSTQNPLFTFCACWLGSTGFCQLKTKKVSLVVSVAGMKTKWWMEKLAVNTRGRAAPMDKNYGTSCFLESEVQSAMAPGRTFVWLASTPQGYSGQLRCCVPSHGRYGDRRRKNFLHNAYLSAYSTYSSFRFQSPTQILITIFDGLFWRGNLWRP